MKNLLVLVTALVLLAGIIAILLLPGERRSEMNQEEFDRYLHELHRSIASRDLERIRPVVQVTHRRIEDSFAELDALIGESAEDVPGRRWAAAAHEAFAKLRAGDAPRLRKPCIEAVLQGARSSGQIDPGLQTFFEGRYESWWEGLRGPDRAMDKASLPCFAELVSFQGKPAWLVVVNWEDAEDVSAMLSHVAILLVEPGSGDVLAAERCE